MKATETQLVRRKSRAFQFYAPVRIEPEANRRDHWATRKRRFDRQRETVRMSALAAGWMVRDVERAPQLITLTRIAPRRCDDDNAIGGGQAGLANRLQTTALNPVVTVTWNDNWLAGGLPSCCCLLPSAVCSAKRRCCGPTPIKRWPRRQFAELDAEVSALQRERDELRRELDGVLLTSFCTKCGFSGPPRFDVVGTSRLTVQYWCGREGCGYAVPEPLSRTLRELRQRLTKLTNDTLVTDDRNNQETE